jgi:hypothetical protein
MAGKRAETLLAMTFFIKRFTLERAWTDLTDDEFFWQPTPDTWTVRPVSESCTPTPFVSGDWEADYDAPLTMGATNLAKDGEPLTNIAWLYWHVGSMPGRAAQRDFHGGAHTAACGWTSPYFTKHPIFTSADDAVSTMRAGWHAFVDALQAADDEQLERPMQAWGAGREGPPRTGAQILASIINEISHHGTQIGVLRDFYRLRAV